MQNRLQTVVWLLAAMVLGSSGFAQSTKDARISTRTDFSTTNDRTAASKRVPTQKTKTPAGPVTRGINGSIAAATNDACTAQESIAGEASFTFDNRFATTDGPDHAACSFSGETQIANDVWFCWTAPPEQCSGDFVASTCGAPVDTKIAVYEGCSCPPGDANLVTCSDDDCGLQARVNFNPVPGQQYLIRLGSFPGATFSQGTGVLRLQCIPPQPCNQQSSDCQSRALSGLLNSNGTQFSVADDFTPSQTGQITNVCWWGTYADANSDPCQSFAVDAFEMNYYRGTAGEPGELLASFSQKDGTLTVDGPIATGLDLQSTLPEFAYSATHAPVNVTAGECYWIEIKNPIVACDWFWEESIEANGRAFQDGVFGSTPGFDARDGVVADATLCLDIPLSDSNACLPPPPPNDDCINASQVATEGSIFYETAGATLDGPNNTSCLFSNQSQIDHDEWICWTSPCDGEVFVRTCGETDVDTKLAVYDGCDCPTAATTPLDCDDDLCSTDLGLQSMLVFNAVQGNNYLIRAGTFLNRPGGPGLLDIQCGAPPNAACPTAGACCQGATVQSGRAGCTGKNCCETVCACDPFCCEVFWDATCAGPTSGQSGGCNAATLCGCSGQCGTPQAGNCCVANGTPACSDTTCCETVCGNDSFCCNTDWDDQCAASAVTLCQDVCGPLCPIGPVDFVSPDPMVVDARRPHDRNDTMLTEGIQAIQLTGPAGAESSCFDLCETMADGNPNAIAQVVDNAGSYTLTLARPITKGAVTTVTYTAGDTTTTTAEFISHPGNVNDDTIANAADVTDFVAALSGNMTLPWGIFSEDIDRSGIFSPLDLLELINVLNGSEAFDAWNGTAKPIASPTCP